MRLALFRNRTRSVVYEYVKGSSNRINGRFLEKRISGALRDVESPDGRRLNSMHRLYRGNHESEQG